MALVLSFPFRLGVTGAAVSVEQFSRAGSEEAMAHMILTRRRERAYVPTFGITDPTWRRIDPHEIRTSWSVHGDGRRIEHIETAFTSDTTQTITVELGR